MKQNTFCRGLVFSIIIVFVGTSMSPLARAVSSQQSFLTDSLNEASIQINGIDRKQESQARSDGLAPHPLFAQKTPAGGKHPVIEDISMGIAPMIRLVDIQSGRLLLMTLVR
jgi:hypothetical protein